MVEGMSCPALAHKYLFTATGDGVIGKREQLIFQRTIIGD
jgi:hypothetical protein